MSTLNCPACSSEQTQRLSAIVDSGTSHTRGTSVGGFGGVAGGARGFGGMNHAVHNSTTKSALANKLAAPARKPAAQLYLVGAVLVLVSFYLFSVSALLFLLVMAGGGLLIFTGYKNSLWNKSEFPLLISRWSSSFYCNRCQTVYIPAGFAQANSGPVIEAGANQASFVNSNSPNRLQD